LQVDEGLAVQTEVPAARRSLRSNPLSEERGVETSFAAAAVLVEEDVVVAGEVLEGLVECGSAVAEVEDGVRR
jgi:hypothetical protein